MKKSLACALGLLALAHALPLRADDAARAVYAMICAREAMALGHKDEALRRYVSDCVSAKMKVYTDDMSDPLTAHLPKSC
jgi:hypothetical protein